MRWTALFLVPLLLVSSSPARGGEGEPLLARLVSADEAVRDAAREEWDGLDEESRSRLARPALGSPDPDVAAFAAGALDPLRLSLVEVRRRADVLSGRAAGFFLPEGEAEGDVLEGLGAPELPALWRGFAELEIADPAAYFGEEGESSRSDTFEQTHREMLPEHLPVLVELLEAEDPVVFRDLLWTLSLASEFTDRYREEVARAMLYAMARLRAESEGGERPRLADFHVEAPERGLPAAFKTLAAHLWRAGSKPIPFGAQVSIWLPNPAWLLRWARELTPTEEDLPFLLEVAGRKDWLYAQVWAVGALARLGTPQARAFLDQASRREDPLAPFAAAGLARLGEPARLLALLGRANPPAHTAELALTVDPRAVWGRWSGTDLEWNLPFDPSDRSLLEADFGLHIPEEAFRPFLERKFAPERLPAEPLLWIGVDPDLFSDELLRAAVEKVVAGPPPGEADFGDYPNGWLPTLAALEARAPELLGKLLDWCAQSPSVECRRSSLLLLARLGDGRRIEDTLEDLDGLLPVDPPEAIRAGADLGALADARLEAALRERARGPERPEAFPALVALCFGHGLDPRLVPALTWLDPSAFEAGLWTSFRDAALAGDPVGALLALYRSDEVPDADGLPWLGASGDPRVVAYFTSLREERSPLYWPATAGLALAGDEGAKAELDGWARDARTTMLDELDELPDVAMEVDPAIVDLEIGYLESNCCLGFYAIDALGRHFPTLDPHYEMHDFPQTKRRIRSWFDRHRGHFVWSRLLGGWVPANQG